MQFQFKPSPLRYRSAVGTPARAAVNACARPSAEGNTLIEVVLAMAIVAMVFAAIINGYIVTAVRQQWTGYSLAAQSLGLQTIEQARSAVWDNAVGKNDLTNMTLFSSSWNSGTLTYSGYMTNILDVPWKGTNYTVATNYVSIRQIYANGVTNPAVQLQMVRVDTVWPFMGWGGYSLQFYTNTVCAYMAPDNRDPSSLGVDDAP